MTIDETLKTVLTSIGRKVYESTAPADATYPCIVYQRISTFQMRTHAGNELERPRIQVSCWASTPGEALTLAESVKSSLDLNQVNFQLASKENELVDKEPESGKFRRILDFYIWN